MQAAAQPSPVTRYLYSGHAIGVCLHFCRLDDLLDPGCDTPALGVSALPQTGGLSKSDVSNHAFHTDLPRSRQLLGVSSIATSVSGKRAGTLFQTEIKADMENLTVLEKLNIGRLQMQFLSTRDALDPEKDPQVSSTGCALEGLRLGNVDVILEIDNDPIQYSGCKDQLAAYYRTLTPEYRREYSWRFATPPDATEIQDYNGFYKWSMIKSIQLRGPEIELQDITCKDYTIHWTGFGKIILGEYLVKDQRRRLTMARLAMGSNAEGDGTVGEGETNGQCGG